MKPADRIILMPIVFNSLSDDLGGFREQILPEAVDSTLRQRRDLRALAQHDFSLVIGRLSAGTLAIEKTTAGLRAEIDPPASSYARDLMEAIRRRDITGASFAFETLEDSWSREDGVIVRTIHDMTIFEVSAVTFPAYPGTSAQVRSNEPVALEAVMGKHRKWVRLMEPWPRFGQAETRGIFGDENETGMLLRPDGTRMTRPADVLRALGSFLAALRVRYGDSVPLTTPAWSERRGWVETTDQPLPEEIARLHRRRQSMGEGR